MEQHADGISRSLFIDTNLDTHFAIIVSPSDTVSHLKKKILFEHRQCFPAIGDIEIDSLKVKRRGHFYHLTDSILVKSAFATVNGNWFLSVDASRLVEDGSGTGPSVGKKRKTGEKEASVEASEDPSGENIRTNNEKSLDNNIHDLSDGSTRLEKFEKCSGMDQEATVVSSSIENVRAETHVQRNTEAGQTIVPDVFMALEKDIEPETSQKDKGESLLVQNNSQTSETAPAVLMAVEEHIQQETPSKISQKENELVKERVLMPEIPSSSLRASDCELDDSEKDNTAEEEVLSSSFIRTIHALLSLSNAEKIEVLEKTLPDDVTMQEVEISKPTEMVEETLKEIKDSVGSRKKKKDVGNDEGIDRKSENKNKKMDGEKRKKRKKRAKRSAKNGEGGTDQFETPKKKSKTDTPRTSKSAHANKAHGEPSSEVFLNQKSDRPRVILGLASVKAMQKSAPEVSKSRHVKNLLSGSGTISGGDRDKHSADDNASAGASSTVSRTNGSFAVKRNVGGETLKSKSKNVSMTHRLRSSPRFKRAKVIASESEPVEFVPESSPI